MCYVFGFWFMVGFPYVLLKFRYEFWFHYSIYEKTTNITSSILYLCDGSEMTLNYWMIVERYSFLNGVVCGSIPFMKSSLYLMGEKKSMWVGSQEPTHWKVGSNSHLAPRGFLSKIGPKGSNSHWIARCWLFIYLSDIVNQHKQQFETEFVDIHLCMW